MAPKTRRILLGVVAVLLIGGFGYWWYSGFSLDFMRFFAAEERTIGVSISPRSSPPEGCFYTNVCQGDVCEAVLRCPSGTPIVPDGGVSCSPATQTITAGGSATLTATGGDPTTYQWFTPGGLLGNPQNSQPSTATVNYSEPGTKIVTVQAARGDGSGSIDSVTCTVIVK